MAPFNYTEWLAMTDAERAELAEYRRTHARRKPRTTGPRGVPVRGTGRRWRRGHRHGRKMQPYLRPRVGGGTSKRNDVYDW